MNITIREASNPKIHVLNLSEEIPNNYEGGALFPMYPDYNPTEGNDKPGLEIVFNLWHELYNLEEVVGVGINRFEIIIETSSADIWSTIEPFVLYVIADKATAIDTIGIKPRKNMFLSEKEQIERQIRKSGKKLLWLQE